MGRNACILLLLVALVGAAKAANPPFRFSTRVAMRDAKVPRSKFQVSDIFDEIDDAGALKNVSTPFVVRIT